MKHIHIGPYLTVPKTDCEHVQTIRECGAGCSKTEYSAMVRFCPSCGSGVAARERRDTRFAAPNIHRLSDRWTDFMWAPEHVSKHPAGAVWLPNHRGFSAFPDDTEPHEHQAVDMGALDLPGLLARAQAHYAEFVHAVELELSVRPTWHSGLVLYAF